VYLHHRLTIYFGLGGTIIDVVWQIFHPSSPVIRFPKMFLLLFEHTSPYWSMHNLHKIQYKLALYHCYYSEKTTCKSTHKWKKNLVGDSHMFHQHWTVYVLLVVYHHPMKAFLHSSAYVRFRNWR
jgi:hypothetical protein